MGLFQKVSLEYTTSPSWISSARDQLLPLIPFIIGAALLLLFGWTLVVYPVFLSPLRCLPRVEGPISLSKILLECPRGRMTSRWMKTVPNTGLIHFRDHFNQSYIFPTSHEAMMDVLVNKSADFEKPWYLRSFLTRLAGQSVLTMEGPQQKLQRKILNPVFSPQSLKALYPGVWEESISFLERLNVQFKNQSPLADSIEVDASDCIRRLVLGITGKVILGYDFDSQRENRGEEKDGFLAILEPKPETLPFLAMNIILPQWVASRVPSKANRDFNDGISCLRRLCDQAASEKRRVIRSKQENAEFDLLGQIVERGIFPEAELGDQLATLFIAGHDTTATALLQCCYEISRNQGIQEELRHQIRSQISSRETPIDWATLESLPLLNAVCQEVLRLYPPIPVTIRQAARKTRIAGHEVPKGTQILISPYATNRDSRIWGEAAEEFLPYRWFDANKQSMNTKDGMRSHFGIDTFLHGPRACIGRDLARIQLRCALAVIIGRFQIELTNPELEPPVRGVIAVSLSGRIGMRLTKIEGW